MNLFVTVSSFYKICCYRQCTDACTACLKAGLGQAECAIVNGYNYYSDCISNVRIHIAKVIFCFVINDDDKSYTEIDSQKCCIIFVDSLLAEPIIL